MQTFLPSFTVFRFLARLAFCLSSQTGKKRTKKTAKIFLFFSPFYFGVWSEKKNGGKKNGGKTKWRQKMATNEVESATDSYRRLSKKESISDK